MVMLVSAMPVVCGHDTMLHVEGVICTVRASRGHVDQSRKKKTALCHLELATVNDIHHILNGQAGLCNVCGNDNLADPFRGALEGLPLLSRGNRRMKRDDPMLPLPVLGCAG